MISSSAATALPTALDAELAELQGRRPTAAAQLARALHAVPRPPTRAEAQLVYGADCDLARAELADLQGDEELALEHAKDAIRGYCAAIRLARRSP